MSAVHRHVPQDQCDTPSEAPVIGGSLPTVEEPLEDQRDDRAGERPDGRQHSTDQRNARTGRVTLDVRSAVGDEHADDQADDGAGDDETTEIGRTAHSPSHHAWFSLLPAVALRPGRVVLLRHAVNGSPLGSPAIPPPSSWRRVPYGDVVTDE